jgi:serine/threonine protein kinase
MLYEVLTGKLPFDTDNEFELMKSQTEMTPTPPREINPAIPEDVEAAIMKAIQKNPDDRFQTGGEFREVLLGAGFAASGTMHGVTGTFKRQATHPSRPDVSHGGVAVSGESAGKTPKKTRLGKAEAAPAASSGGIKQTRLGAAAAPAGAIKTTRLGTSNAEIESHDAALPAAQPAFFSKLSAVHYAGAGVAALLLIGTLIAVPVMLFGGKTAEEKPVKTETKSEPPPQKPDVITMPQQPSQSQTSTVPADSPVVSQPSPALPSTGELTPIENAPKTDKTTTAAQKPPAAKPAAPAAKPKGEAKSSRAEKLLTGN